jgi:hypothetical protein
MEYFMACRWQLNREDGTLKGESRIKVKAASQSDLFHATGEATNYRIFTLLDKKYIHAVLHDWIYWQEFLKIWQNDEFFCEIFWKR